MPASPGDGTNVAPAIFREGEKRLPHTRLRINFQNTRNLINFVTGFHNITISLIVKTTVDRSIKTSRHHFSYISFRQKDILWVIASRSFSINFYLFQRRQDGLVEICQPVRKRRSEFVFGFHSLLYLSLRMNL